MALSTFLCIGEYHVIQCDHVSYLSFSANEVPKTVGSSAARAAQDTKRIFDCMCELLPCMCLRLLRHYGEWRFESTACAVANGPCLFAYEKISCMTLCESYCSTVHVSNDTHKLHDIV